MRQRMDQLLTRKSHVATLVVKLLHEEGVPIDTLNVCPMGIPEAVPPLAASLNVAW